MAKSIREQIAAKQALIAAAQTAITELEAKLGDEVDPSKVVAGATVGFNYGKGTTVRPLEGTVAGVKAADPTQPKSSPLVAVAVGVGFDAQIVKVYLSAITKVIAEAPAAV